MKHAKNLMLVDLFAGCGGLSLGFERAGFEPIVVSELNASARETYLANRVGHEESVRRAVAIDSLGAGNRLDLEQQLLTVGDIHLLDNARLRQIRKAAESSPLSGVDVVAGGPPCQGFSGIGHRRTHRVEKQEIPSNHLYQEMIRVIHELRPKAFVFENVRGLLSARWTAGGEKGEVWEAVRNAFRKTLGADYLIAWDLVQACWYGVPQNRPRVIMIGLRKEFASKLPPTGDRALEIGLLPPRDATLKPPSPVEVMSDLCDPNWLPNGAYLQSKAYPLSVQSEYQRAMRAKRGTTFARPKGSALEEQEYSRHSPRVVERFQAILNNDTRTLEKLKTKKFAQRCLPIEWGPDGPSITVTSLPDDYCHYEQPRSLTVREWARLQGFPDWYVFKGPRTTGGERRAGNPSKGNWSREVPKYTQIGNAVPVKLAEAIAKHLRKFIG